MQNLMRDLPLIVFLLTLVAIWGGIAFFGLRGREDHQQQ
jgi:hypothetical protein